MSLEQIMDEEVRKAFKKKILPSIVCIRNEAEYKAPRYSTLTKRPMIQLHRDVAHGTGYVFGTQEINGRQEYLVLTNYHVQHNDEVMEEECSDEDHSSPTNLLLRQSFNIVTNCLDEDIKNFIKLEVVRKKEDGDAAVLRTIGAPKLHVGEFIRNYDEISDGDMIITAGYPGGEKLITTVGRITTTDDWDIDLAAAPAHIYLADIRIDAGQSGSPVFVARKDNGIKFHLIGLEYAKAEDDTTRMVMPYANFSEIIENDISVESRKPNLKKLLSLKDIESIYKRTSYRYGEMRYQLAEMTQDSCTIRAHVTHNELVLEHEYIDIYFSRDILVDKITYRSGDVEQTLTMKNEPVDVQERYNALFIALFNHFTLAKALNERSAKKNLTVNENREKKYYKRIINEQIIEINRDISAFYDDLYRKEIVPVSLSGEGA